MKLITILSILFFCPLSFAESPMFYIGQKFSASAFMCYALEDLRHRYCPLNEETDISRCIKNVIEVTPPKYKKQMMDAVIEMKSKYQQDSIAIIDEGYKKMLSDLNGDKNQACLLERKLIIQTKQQRLNEIKELFTQVK